MDNKNIKAINKIVDKLLNIIAYIIIYIKYLPKRIHRLYKKVMKVNIKLLINSAVIYVSLTVTAIITVLYIAEMLSYEVRIAAYVDGIEVGYVENTYVMEGARAKVEYEINNYIGGGYNLEYDIQYKFLNTTENEYLTTNDCYKYLTNISSLGVIDMYALYIDDVFIGCLPKSTDINLVMIECKNKSLNDIISCDCDVKDIKLYNDVYFNVERRVKTELSSCADIYSKLMNNISYETANVMRTAQTQTPQSDINLRYIKIKNEMFTEVIKCNVEYQETDTLYVGLEKQAREGSDGILELVYEVEYLDDEILSRKLISEKVLIELEPTIILKGSKVPPPAESTGKFIWPVDVLENETPYITSYFGEQREEIDGDQSHYGIDIAVPEDNYIYASDGGFVDYSGETPSYGNFVRIQHKDGMSSYYAHMSERLVELGDYVYPGQIIGKIGMTGVATAPHLHFEIRYCFTPIDPLEFLP